VVIVKEAAVNFVANTGGMWTLNAVYEYKKAGNWTS
jgi:hypothetical protein